MPSLETFYYMSGTEEKPSVNPENLRVYGH
jgi:hypothetical protein